MDIGVYVGDQGCDDKSAGNLELYRISVPENVDLDTSGKRLRQVLGRLVVVENDGFLEWRSGPCMRPRHQCTQVERFWCEVLIPNNVEGNLNNMNVHNQAVQNRRFHWYKWGRSLSQYLQGGFGP